MADLPIRETILGVIKSRDYDNRGNIHTSDFRSAISDLGFHFGDPVVENILVHCVINSEGFLFYADLERELARERRVHNTKVANQPPPRIKTSTGTPSQPWRADVVHNQKMQSERQARLLQEKHSDVFQTYQKFEENAISSDLFIRNLENLGIIPTGAFLNLLRKNQSCEITFREFMQSLVHYEDSSVNDISNKPAGGTASLLGKNDGRDREEAQAGLFYARKRIDFVKKSEIFVNDSTNGAMKATRKMGGFKDDPNEVGNKTTHVSQRMSSSVGSILQHDGKSVPLLSHAATEMQKARMGKSIGNSADDFDLSYSSEQKMLREQVLASLRKLDSGEFTRVEFQDKIYTMGIELPLGVLKLLKIQETTGLLDWAGCVRELDGCVFKLISMQNKESEGTVLNVKDRLIQAIQQKGSFDSLTTLLQLFHSVDTDGSGDLSFSEFVIGCRKLIGNQRDSEINDSELRILFNSFDHNGDGNLSYDEFIKSLQGEISPLRKHAVNQAFRLLDKNGLKCFPLSTFIESFHADKHPDALTGAKSEWKIRREVQDFFQQSSIGKSVSSVDEISIDKAQFDIYMCNFSPSIDSDDEFVNLIQNLMGMSGLKNPPPAEYLSFKGSKTHAPIAKQSHGDYITWNQEKSALERETEYNAAGIGKKLLQSPHSTSNLVTWKKPDGSALNNNEVVNDFAVDGLRAVTSRSYNPKELSLLAWSTKKGPKAAPTMSPLQVAKTMQNGVDEHEDGRYLIKNYKWSETKRQQYAAGCPYGISDTPPASSPTKSKGKVQSLAEIVRSK